MSFLLNAIRGSAKLKIFGPRPERMLNLLALNGIYFTQAERPDEYTLCFTVLRSDAERAQQLATQACFEVEVLRYGGFPRLRHRLKKRIALFILPPVCILSAFILSFFIWEIDIVGNESVSDAQILSALKEQGIGIGSLGIGIDRELLRDKIIADLPKISWITINVNGCRAEVIVRERTDAPEISDANIPADIIAARTGLICEISVFNGIAQAAVGETVLQGELLISGTMPSIAGKTRFIRSQGIIQARTWYEISEKIPLEYISKRYTGDVKQKKSLTIGNYRLNLYLNGGNPLDSCDKIIKRKRLTLPGGMLLPLETVTAEYREYIAEPCQISVSEAEDLLQRRLTAQLTEQINGTPISFEFETENDGDFVTVTLRAECLENIGLTVPLNLQQ